MEPPFIKRRIEMIKEMEKAKKRDPHIQKSNRHQVWVFFCIPEFNLISYLIGLGARCQLHRRRALGSIPKNSNR